MYNATMNWTTDIIDANPRAVIVFASKATTAYGINLITVIATDTIIL